MIDTKEYKPLKTVVDLFFTMKLTVFDPSISGLLGKKEKNKILLRHHHYVIWIYKIVLFFLRCITICLFNMGKVFAYFGVVTTSLALICIFNGKLN